MQGGKVGKGEGTAITHLQVFSQMTPLLYSSVPSQQSEVEVGAEIRAGDASTHCRPGLLPHAGAS